MGGGVSFLLQGGGSKSGPRIWGFIQGIEDWKGHQSRKANVVFHAPIATQHPTTVESLFEYDPNMQQDIPLSVRRILEWRPLCSGRTCPLEDHQRSKGGRANLEVVGSLSYSRLSSRMFSGLRSVCIRFKSWR